MAALDRLIESSVKCSICGTPGVGTCDCWERCSCGWYALKGNLCRNPATTKCSTKVKYGS